MLISNQRCVLNVGYYCNGAFRKLIKTGILLVPKLTQVKFFSNRSFNSILWIYLNSLALFFFVNVTVNPHQLLEMRTVKNEILFKIGRQSRLSSQVKPKTYRTGWFQQSSCFNFCKFTKFCLKIHERRLIASIGQ